MEPTAGRVAWIAIAPIKSMALQFLDAVELGLEGLPGDRAFAVVDAAGRMVNGKRAGVLATARPEIDPATGILTIRLPDGTAVSGPIVLGDRVETIFPHDRRPARFVDGPWAEAISSWLGRPLRLVAPAPGEGPDRGPTVTLLTVAALASLAAAGGAPEPLDCRRFRMNIGIAGVAAHAEDGWLGRDVRIGSATVRLAGNIGRCAVTTHDPSTGRPSFDTLHVLQATRGHLATSEPLPFGVWSEVVSPGRVALEDPIGPV